MVTFFFHEATLRETSRPLSFFRKIIYSKYIRILDSYIIVGNTTHPFQLIENSEQLKQRWWSYFRYDAESDGPVYSIIMPPPNVTGSLHLGHALSSTQQDVLIRFHKALGKNVLWLPGTDHAGIATQVMVEKEIKKEGKTRKDLGRSAFLEQVWRWKDTYETRILHQMKRMGFAADWSKLRFTLDETVSYATREAFIRLYRQGKIYKAKRLVNWDPVLRTALSDLEVESVEEEGRMWTISYDVEGRGTVQLATTRPETLLGDTGIAVHPQDERYAGCVGLRAKVPLVDRWVPIVADERVDPEKGTGVVKLTPAHDFLDFAIAQTHGLEFIDIFDEAGCLNSTVPKPFQGLDKDTARQQILEALGERVVGSIAIQHSTPHSQRSGCVIEPRLTEQWFLDTSAMAKRALEVVEQGACQFFPKDWEKSYAEWLVNIQPWCISRQLWWGHQIPAWYDEHGNIFVAQTFEEAQNLARTQGSTGPLTQDEDVLDTWFSSGLWPFSTLGWPNMDQQLFKACYPTTVLITGFDIIFFWVARMVMLGTALTDEVPFRHVCIHPLVCDEKGKKMSKTKGNVVDPMTLVDKYGVDALRFALTTVATPSAYTTFGEKHVEQSRNFLTKLWNLVRFAEFQNIVGVHKLPTIVHHNMNAWIIYCISSLAQNVSNDLSTYNFHAAADRLYSGIWGDLCDWYIEWVKDALKYEEEVEEIRQVAGWVLNSTLIVLQPFIPFAAQALWEKLNTKDTKGVFEYPWPNIDFLKYACGVQISRMQEVVIALRRIRAEFKIASRQEIEVQMYASKSCIEEFDFALKFIERTTYTHFSTHADCIPDEGRGLFVHLDSITLVLAIQHLLDMEKEILRLEQQRAKLDNQISEWKNRLAVDAFQKNAAPEVVKDLEQRCIQNLEALQRIETDLVMLKQGMNS